MGNESIVFAVDPCCPRTSSVPLSVTLGRARVATSGGPNFSICHGPAKLRFNNRILRGCVAGE